jgi:cystathionine gamma-synthase
LVAWLKRIADLKVDDTLDGVKGGLISRIWHSSLQQDSAFDVKAQMEGGYNATFGLLLEKAEWAAALPFACEYFVVRKPFQSINFTDSWHSRPRASEVLNL